MRNTHTALFLFGHIMFSKAVIQTKPEKLAVTVGYNGEYKGTTQAKPEHPFQGKNIKKPKGDDRQNPKGADQGVTYRHTSQKEPILTTVVF